MDGVHKICLRGTPELFKDKPQQKYEMSIQFEPLHELLDEVQREIGVAPTINLASKIVSKDHIDKVDIEIDQLYKKAQTIINEQRYQREKQLNFKEEQIKFSSNFVLYVSL